MLLDLSEIVIRQGMRVGVDVDQAGVEDPDLVFAVPIRGHLTFSNGGDVISVNNFPDFHLCIASSPSLDDRLLLLAQGAHHGRGQIQVRLHQFRWG